MNPLEIDEILHIPFNFLEPGDLKNVRFVGKLWEEEARKVMCKVSLKFCSVNEVPDNEKSLEKFNSACANNPRLTEIYKSFVIEDFSPSGGIWQGFLQVSGHSLLSLSVVTNDRNCFFEGSAYSFKWNEILRQTPCLKHLFLGIETWAQSKWPEEDTFKIPSLQTFGLIEQKIEESGLDLGNTCQDWSADDLWAFIIQILRCAPNLSKLDISRGERVPFFIQEKIFDTDKPMSEIKSELKGLLLTWEKAKSTFFNFLCEMDPYSTKLTSVTLPRIYNATLPNWNNFFSKFSSRLKNLNIGKFTVKILPQVEPGALLYFTDIPKIQFPYIFPDLRSLAIHTSMISFPAFHSKFPALEELTIAIGKCRDLKEEFLEYSQEGTLEGCTNLNVRKLSLIFDHADDDMNERHRGIDRLFKILVECFPNLNTLAIKKWVGMRNLASCLDIFANQKIEILHIKLNYWLGLWPAYCMILSGAEDDEECWGRKDLKKLKEFKLGFGNCVLDSVLNKGFVRDTILRMENLKSLEITTCRIESEAVIAEIKNGLPGLARFILEERKASEYESLYGEGESDEDEVEILSDNEYESDGSNVTTDDGDSDWETESDTTEDEYEEGLTRTCKRMAEFLVETGSVQRIG